MAKKLDELVSVKSYNSVGGPAIAIKYTSPFIGGKNESVELQAKDARVLAKWILKTFPPRSRKKVK